MDKRYQVFVSSTYTDLRDERQRVMQTLMELDCIPAGMELFPAADEQQWAFIQKVIDDCDYYLLILGNRYGSMAEDGISYTEKEFDYAVQTGKKVLAFPHADPDSLPAAQSERDSVAIERLRAFREKVKTGRLVKQWTDARELSGLVATSLPYIIKTAPAVGWVRGDQATNPKIFEELNEVRKKNDELAAKLTRYEGEAGNLVKDLAGFEDEFVAQVSVLDRMDRVMGVREVQFNWGELFGVIGPRLRDEPGVSQVQRWISDYLEGKLNDFYDEVGITGYAFETVEIQFQALGLIDVVGQPEPYWRLTEKGTQAVFQLRAMRRGQAKDSEDKNN